jgi:hypothetical protein
VNKTNKRKSFFTGFLLVGEWPNREWARKIASALGIALGHTHEGQRLPHNRT